MSFPNSDADVRRLVLTPALGRTGDRGFGGKRIQAAAFTAVYVLAGGEWVSYILGAPQFVNARFRGLFPDGVPVATPLTVRAEGQ